MIRVYAAVSLLALTLNAPPAAAAGPQGTCGGKKCGKAMTMPGAKVPAPPQEVNLTFAVGVVRGNGEVVPIARTSFLFAPYSRQAIRTQLQARPGIPPEAPNADAYAKSYAICLKAADAMRDTAAAYGRSSGAEVAKIDEYFKKARDQLDQCAKNLKQAKSARDAWEKVAWAGEAEQVQALSLAGPATQTVTTDLHGEASISLPVGGWYVTGSTKFGTQVIEWSDVPCTVSPGMKKFELSNDNATKIRSGKSGGGRPVPTASRQRNASQTASQGRIREAPTLITNEFCRI